MKGIALFMSVIAPLVMASTASAELRVAASGRDVTPEKMLPVSGVGLEVRRLRPRNKGKLMTRALVLENGKTQVAIVSEPFLGFPAALGAKVRAAGQGHSGLEHPYRRHTRA